MIRCILIGGTKVGELDRESANRARTRDRREMGLMPSDTITGRAVVMRTMHA
jgi:hypothetical protein